MGFGNLGYTQQNADLLADPRTSTSLGLALGLGLRFRFGLSPGLLALFLLFRAAFAGCQHYKHRAAFHLRRGFDHRNIGEGLGDLFQIFERDLRIIHLAAAELDRHTDFVSLQ